MARCPTCGVKDVLNLQVSVDILQEVIVFCGYDDCDFAKRIVRTRTRGGQPIWVSSLPAKEMSLGPAERSCGHVVSCIPAHRNRRTNFEGDS